MLPEASRGVIRLRPELPVWRRWEPGPVGSTGGGTHISVLAGGGVQFRSSRRWEPHGAANSTVPLWAFALQPFFLFLLRLPFSDAEPSGDKGRQPPRTLSISAGLLLLLSAPTVSCAYPRPVTGRQQRGGVRNLGFGVRFTRFESLLARF